MANSEKPRIKYIEVLTLDSPFQADILQEALKTEGINTFVVSYDDTRMEKIVVPQKGWGVLSVPINMVDKAKEVIDTYMASVKDGIVTDAELAEMAQEQFPEEIIKGIEDDQLESELEESAVLKKAREHPHSEDTFEEVYALENYFQAEALSNFLHQEGIDVIIQSYQRTRLEIIVTPQKGWGLLMVPSEQAERAREIIENFEANIEAEAAAAAEKTPESSNGSDTSTEAMTAEGRGEEGETGGKTAEGSETKGSGTEGNEAGEGDTAESGTAESGTAGHGTEKGTEGETGAEADDRVVEPHRGDDLQEGESIIDDEEDGSKPLTGRPRKKRHSDE